MYCVNMNLYYPYSFHSCIVLCFRIKGICRLKIASAFSVHFFFHLDGITSCILVLNLCSLDISISITLWKPILIDHKSYDLEEKLFGSFWNSQYIFFALFEQSSVVWNQSSPILFALSRHMLYFEHPYASPLCVIVLWPL